MDLINFIELYSDGNPMRSDRHELLWDGKGRGKKICFIDKPENIHLH